MQIGEILAACRKERGLSQMELAQALTARGCEVSNQAVSKWEKSMTLPNARQFLALCEVLEIADVRGEFSEGRAGLLSGLNQEGRRRVQDYIQLLRESGRYAEMIEIVDLPSHNDMYQDGERQKCIFCFCPDPEKMQTINPMKLKY